MLTRIFLFILSCFCIASAYSNEPVALGKWRVHLPYNYVNSICETPDKIYCASKHGFYSFIKADGTVERLSPANGFSSYKVQAMTYDWNSGTLIIAYSDCKIEMIKDNTITKNDDIFRKTIIGEKTIHHIQITNGIAYIGTSFGLLELDIVKNEIKNSYLNIGPNGTVIDIFGSTITNDSIYVATKTGVYRGSNNPNNNLADYTNWYLSKSASLKSSHIAAYKNAIYAEIDSQIYRYQNNSWKVYNPGSRPRIITNIEINHNKLIIGSFGDSIFELNDAGVLGGKKINVLTQAIVDNIGQYWYSSPLNGLVLMHSGGEVNYFPNGPRAVAAFNFTNAYDNLWVMGGGFVSTIDAPTFSDNKYYYFNNYEWINSPENPFTYPLYDYVVSSYQKANGRLYIGTFGKGLLQMDNGVPVKIYNETNSPLKKQGDYTIIRGLSSDSRNNLWVSNFNVDSCLLRLTPNGTWTSYKLPINRSSKIVIDSKNNKWIICNKENYGLIVFNESGNTQSVLLNTNKGNGNLPTNSVNDIAFTKSGEMLIGTDQGYVKVRNPNNALTGGDYDAQRVIVSVETGSNLGGYLLGTEVINCIVVDGGDRRWFGTNKGVWLYASDGETLIHHFTKDNSPLISDNVLSIGIMESTGEVFFGTDQGIVSFRSDALPESKNFTELVIFPNPVKPDFNGDIAITGMPDKTLVKITDINGAMVWQTYSNGGMATWNGNSFDGTRVSTGVYMVFCINPDGSETMAGKILFIH